MGRAQAKRPAVNYDRPFGCSWLISSSKCLALLRPSTPSWFLLAAWSAWRCKRSLQLVKACRTIQNKTQCIFLAVQLLLFFGLLSNGGRISSATDDSFHRFRDVDHLEDGRTSAEAGLRHRLGTVLAARRFSRRVLVVELSGTASRCLPAAQLERAILDWGGMLLYISGRVFGSACDSSPSATARQPAPGYQQVRRTWRSRSAASLAYSSDMKVISVEPSMTALTTSGSLNSAM